MRQSRQVRRQLWRRLTASTLAAATLATPLQSPSTGAAEPSVTTSRPLSWMAGPDLPGASQSNSGVNNVQPRTPAGSANAQVPRYSPKMPTDFATQSQPAIQPQRAMQPQLGMPSPPAAAGPALASPSQPAAGNTAWSPPPFTLPPAPSAAAQASSATPPVERYSTSSGRAVGSTPSTSQPALAAPGPDYSVWSPPASSWATTPARKPISFPATAPTAADFPWAESSAPPAMTGSMPASSALGPRIANEVELPRPPAAGPSLGPALTSPAPTSPTQTALPAFRPTMAPPPAAQTTLAQPIVGNPAQPMVGNPAQSMLGQPAVTQPGLAQPSVPATSPTAPAANSHIPHYDRTRSALTGPVGPAVTPPASTSSVGLSANPASAAPHAVAIDGSRPAPTMAQPSASPTQVAARPDPVQAPAGEKYLSRHELDGVSRQAEILVAKGYELADRRMLYAARQQFIQALQMIAQALDAHEAEPYHALALVNGLQALEEAGEFQARSMDVDRTVKDIALGHRTPVLSKVTTPVSTLAAAQMYYAHAQEQLSLAVSPVPAGSSALCALGKLHVEFGREEASFIRNSVPQVKVFHQAALLVDTNNWEAANELAVFLVQSGNVREARGWLQHSVRVSPRAENWHNLAAVHRMFGETDLALRADAEARRLASRGPDGQPLPVNSPVDVQWMEPEEFVQRPTVPQDSMPNKSSPSDAAKPGVATARNPAPPQGIRQAEKPAESRGWGWLPWVR